MKERLRVAYFVFEPHALSNDGFADGAAISYLKDQIAPEMGVDIEFIGPIPFSRLMYNFENGKYDAILLLAKNPDRAALFNYPSNPYGYMESSLLLRKKTVVNTLTSPEQLVDYRIGYAQKAWMTPFMHKLSHQLDLVSAKYATEINFRKLSNGRLDAVYSPDRWSLLYAAKRHGISAKSLLKVPGPAVGYYTVFSKSVPHRLVAAYEEALKSAQKRLPYNQHLQDFVQHQQQLAE